MLAQEDAEYYELPCHSTSIPGLASYSDSYDAFDFVSPLARDEYSDSDSEDEDMEEGTVALQSPPEPSGSSNPFRGLGMTALPSLVHISKEIRLISSSVVEITFGNTRPNSFPGEDHEDEEDDDEEEAILSPDPSFPHPHLLSTIIEEDEDEEASSPEGDSEDEDELSDTETIRPSRSPDCRWAQESMGRAKHSNLPCEARLARPN
jgi:hypothetical protein